MTVSYSFVLSQHSFLGMDENCKRTLLPRNTETIAKRQFLSLLDFEEGNDTKFKFQRTNPQMVMHFVMNLWKMGGKIY